MKATVLKTLSDPKLVWIFDNQHRESACELKMSRRRNGCTQQFVIDRTFIDQDDTRWIIDYKTSQPQPGQSESEFIQSQAEKYRSQLENYRDLMTAAENRNTRLALLLTDIPALIEIESANHNQPGQQHKCLRHFADNRGNPSRIHTGNDLQPGDRRSPRGFPALCAHDVYQSARQ